MASPRNIITAGAAALFLLVVLASIILPVLADSNDCERRRGGSHTLRGVHVGLYTFSKSNNGWFTGLDSSGKPDGINVEDRFQRLIEEDFITPEYALSPSEIASNTREWDGIEAFSSNHYSHSMLQVPDTGGRHAEWHETVNPKAIVLSDRNTGTPQKTSSIHTDTDGPWQGGVLWNDNSFCFDQKDSFDTRYGSAPANKDDALFTSTGSDDVLLIHRGN